MSMYGTASELYYELLEIYFDKPKSRIYQMLTDK